MVDSSFHRRKVGGMHPPDSFDTQAKLEPVGDEVHLVVALRPLAALDLVPEIFLPRPVVVGRSLVQYPLPVNPHLLQRENQERVFHARETRERFIGI